MLGLCLWWIERRPGINFKNKKTFSYSDIMKCILPGMFLVVHTEVCNAESGVPFTDSETELQRGSYLLTVI